MNSLDIDKVFSATKSIQDIIPEKYHVLDFKEDYDVDQAINDFYYENGIPSSLSEKLTVLRDLASKYGYDPVFSNFKWLIQ